LAKGKGSNSLHKEALMGASTIFLFQPLWTKLKGIVLCNGLSYHIRIFFFYCTESTCESQCKTQNS